MISVFVINNIDLKKYFVKKNNYEKFKLYCERSINIYCSNENVNVIDVLI